MFKVALVGWLEGGIKIIGMVGSSLAAVVELEHVLRSPGGLIKTHNSGPTQFLIQ